MYINTAAVTAAAAPNNNPPATAAPVPNTAAPNAKVPTTRTVATEVAFAAAWLIAAGRIALRLLSEVTALFAVFVIVLAREGETVLTIGATTAAAVFTTAAAVLTTV